MLETVTLAINEKDACELYKGLLRSRNGLRKAITACNLGDIGYYFGWIDSQLTELVQTAPAHIRNAVKNAVVEARQGYSTGAPAPVDTIVFGGGGNKPD